MAADIYARPVETVRVPEATALGAAMIGAVGVGLFADLCEAVEEMVDIADRREPIDRNVRLYNEMYGIFDDTYHALSRDVYPAISRIQGFLPITRPIAGFLTGLPTAFFAAFCHSLPGTPEHRSGVRSGAAVGPRFQARACRPPGAVNIWLARAHGARRGKVVVRVGGAAER